jgi:hypothetical protein
VKRSAPGEDEILVVSLSAAADAVLLLLSLAAAAAKACAMGNGEHGTCWDCDLRVENDPSFLWVTDWGRGAGRHGLRDRRFWQGRDRADWGGKPGGAGRGDRGGCRGDTEQGVIRSNARRG